MSLTERKEAWLRILVGIISCIILRIWGIAVGVVTIVHWFIVVFSGKRKESLAGFCEYWNTETYKFFRYLTFVSNKRPFPFSSMKRMSKFGK
jgi:hypothetical protein